MPIRLKLLFLIVFLGMALVVNLLALGYLARTTTTALQTIEAVGIKEAAGLDVTLSNWRGVFAPPDLSAEQQAAVVAAVEKMHTSPEWQQALEQNGWTDFLKAGDEFTAFLGTERTRVEGVLRDIGLVE